MEIVAVAQTQQKPCERTACTSSRLEGSELSYEVPSVIHSAAGVHPLEAKLDVLEEPRLQPCSRRLHILHGTHLWKHLLGCWEKIVSSSIDSFMCFSEIPLQKSSFFTCLLQKLYSGLWCLFSWHVLECGSSTSSDLIITMGSLYGSTLFICFNNAGTVQAMVSIERTVHYREKAAGMYSAIPYALAQVCPFRSLLVY